MKKIGLVALVLVIFVTAAYIATIATSKKKSPTTTNNTSTQIHHYTQTADTKKKDQQIVDNMSQMLAIIANYYSANSQTYPSNDAKGWQQILEQVPTTSVFVYPYTNTFYAPATGADPDYGQMQFAADTACDDKNNFVKNNYRSLALRTRTVAGIRCVSIGIQNTVDKTN